MDELALEDSGTAASADAALIDGHAVEEVGEGGRALPRRPTRL